MDGIARWMGLTKAVYYTARMGYFKKKGRGVPKLHFVCHVKDFDPAHNAKMFIEVFNFAVEQGCYFTVHKKQVKTSKHINKEAVLEIDRQIYRCIGMKAQVAIVHTIQAYVNNLIYEGKL